jgi:hypothetical protein
VNGCHQIREISMNWNQLQLDAKGKGYLVYAMNQAQTDVTTQPGPWGTATTGYCAGLCIYWVSLCYDGKDLPFDAGTKEATGSAWQATAIQNYIDNIPSVADPSGWYEGELKKFKMALSPGNRATRAHGPTGSFLCAVADNAYGCYLVNLSRDGGAHCIAIRHGKDNRVHLFDANNGHFVRPTMDVFQDFLDWYLKKSGYDARYNRQTWICGVRPPIA